MLFSRFLFPALLLAGPALAQSAPPCPDSAVPGSSQQWVRAVGQLPLPQQLSAVRQRMLCDTAYRSSFQPVGCRIALGLANRNPAPAAAVLPPVDARPLAPLPLYIIDGTPAAFDTAAAVREFWHQEATQPIRQVAVLYGQNATTIFGPRVAGGVIILTTRASRP